MADYTRVPPERLGAEVLQAVLEEFASRDGTDYGERELTLAEKAGNLRRQLEAGEICILYHHPTEAWDLVDLDRVATLLDD
jgi:uncharacterized protein YheU (UPF0270 family)